MSRTNPDTHHVFQVEYETGNIEVSRQRRFQGRLLHGNEESRCKIVYIDIGIGT